MTANGVKMMKSGRSFTAPDESLERGIVAGTESVRETGEVDGKGTEPVVTVVRNGSGTATGRGDGRRRGVARGHLGILSPGITEIEDGTGAGHRKACVRHP
jgi:hypothetical protein